jgi:hypothetical protein
MNMHRPLLVIALGALGAGVLPDDAHAQSMTCQNANFSQTVLTRFPRIREACLEMTTQKGEPYAVFKSEVARVRSDGVDVRFMLPDGTKSDRRYIKTRPEFRVLIEKTPTRVRDLAVGQELTAYVKVTEPVVALAPADTSVAEIEPVPLESTEPPVEQRVAQVMPATASNGPLLGLIGLCLLALSTCLREVRGRMW